MKKIFFATALSLMAASCKKEGVKTDTPEKTASQEKPELSFSKKYSSSPEKITQMLQPKDNDTLYVTNFFATWCGPCMREIPEFKAKMDELKGKPVKFTFVDLDDMDKWDTDVKNFAEEQNLTNHVILVDGASLTPDFFVKNFKEWKGETIPFTVVKKRDKSREMQGAMSKDELVRLLGSLK